MLFWLQGMIMSPQRPVVVEVVIGSAVVVGFIAVVGFVVIVLVVVVVLCGVFVVVLVAGLVWLR